MSSIGFSGSSMLLLLLQEWVGWEDEWEEWEISAGDGRDSTDVFLGSDCESTWATSIDMGVPEVIVQHEGWRSLRGSEKEGGTQDDGRAALANDPSTRDVCRTI